VLGAFGCSDGEGGADDVIDYVTNRWDDWRPGECVGCDGHCRTDTVRDRRDADTSEGFAGSPAERPQSRGSSASSGGVRLGVRRLLSRIQTSGGLQQLTVAVKRLKINLFFHGKPFTERKSVTCHMGSLVMLSAFTWQSTQVNAPRLNSSQAGRYSIYLPRKDGRLSGPWCWLYTKVVNVVYLSADS